MSYILFDIGGTNTRIAVSEKLTAVDKVQKIKTPKTFKEGLVAFEKSLKELEVTSIQAMTGGIRGVLNEDHTSLVNDDVLEGWIDEPLVESFAKKFKTVVTLENDAAIAGMGEAHHGAGIGAEIMVYHTISTGVGGVKIEEGSIDSYHVGFEPGRQILDIDRTILGEDVLPTLQNLVSGTAVEERTGQKPYDIPQTDAIWDQLAIYLAHGLRNTVLYWSPDLIVLGGSMIVGDPKIPLDKIQKHTQEILGDDIPCPLIKVAERGDESGLYGAMALLNQNT